MARWASIGPQCSEKIDRIVVPFGDAALKIAAPQAGERVIDIGVRRSPSDQPPASSDLKLLRHSHSIVAGGLLDTS